MINHFRDLVFTIVMIVSLQACTTTANLYPVKGPMSSHIPLPVLTAHVDGILGNTGNISLDMPNGEKCTGKWSSIAPMQVGYSSANVSGTVTEGMTSAWVTVYGSSYTVGNLPGINKGEAMLVGDQGTVIQVEFYTGSGTANGTGVAMDNKGNIFKVLF